MKNNIYKLAFFLFALVLLYLGSSVIAQVPEKFSYQAVIRDADNHIVENQEIGIQISILQGEKDNNAVYVELHTPETNENGLISIEIGTGEVESGEFENINWNEGPYFIHTAIDPEGGTSYSIEGSSQILSVPYAFHSKMADDLSGEVISMLEQQNQELMERIETIEQLLADQGYHPPVEDVDGNKYEVVQIGDQIWMAENLRTKSFAEGTPIPTTDDESEWQAAVEPFMGVYPHEELDGLDSEEEVLEAYGAFYNGFAVEAERGLCPTGWRVASKDDFDELEDFIAMHDDEAIGNQLKSCRMIDSPLGGDCAVEEDDHPRWLNFDANPGTDDWGFSAVPAGVRSQHGGYVNHGMLSYFWTSTVDPEDEGELIGKTIVFHRDNLGEVTSPRNWGYLVRCIKEDDEE